MILLLTQDGMEVDDGLIVAATDATVASKSAESNPSVKSTTVRILSICSSSFLIFFAVKRQVEELQRGFKDLVLQQENLRSPQEEAQAPLPSTGHHGFFAF
jgi:hypothetical protein